MREALEKIMGGEDLSREEARLLMGKIMDGEVSPVLFGALMVCLRMKGEGEEEIAGFSEAMRERALRVDVPFYVLDTCGTGGDGSGSFNISTASAIIAASCGVKVAKHGNRAVSGRCGSADILEALGARIDLPPEGVRICLEEVGFGFMFAPLFHPAMRRVSEMRRELGIRTVFNILGPLTNPAGALFHVLGVFSDSLLPKMARVLSMLGMKRAWVVHGEDGLDEITLGGKTHVYEVEGGRIREFWIEPSEYGLRRAGKASVKGENAEENAKILLRILSGEGGPIRDICLINSAASIYIYGKARDLAEAIDMAREAVDSGKALALLKRFVDLSRKL